MPTPMVAIEPRPDRIKRPEPPAERKPRRLRRAVAWIAAAVLLWCAWAGYALYDLASALDNEDAVALARRIDWVAVRDGLRDDMSAAPAAAVSSESTIEAMVGTRSLVHLIRNARFTDSGWDGASPTATLAQPDRGFQWFRLSYAFFTGGPFAMRIDIRPVSDSVKQPLVLLMRWNGDWRLTRVFLPSDSRFGAVHAARTPSAASRPAPAAAPAGAAAGLKAILYEEDASNPDGRSYTGTVTWRTAEAASAAGGAPETEVRAEVDAPERPMKLTLAIRRNTDRMLPASHLLDVRIVVPPDSTTGGIQDVPGIMMKTGEDARSVALAGVSVKVNTDYYMIGLSSPDESLNTEMLRQRPWFDVPIRYNNGKRAILSFEKGEAGAKVIEAALAKWDAAKTGAAASKN
jgi:hypothetical protein